VNIKTYQSIISELDTSIALISIVNRWCSVCTLRDNIGRHCCN